MDLRTRLSAMAGVLTGAGCAGLAACIAILDPLIDSHLQPQRDAVHSFAWVAKGQMLGYLPPVEFEFYQISLWACLAIAMLGGGLGLAGGRSGPADEAFETLNARYWGYLIGAAGMLPVILIIWLWLQR